ncbi:hypothetical protein C0J52_28291 [Blattella germanica]|nr:hypothetical protein C0J52_28291 [Blattella germanica]
MNGFLNYCLLQILPLKNTLSIFYRIFFESLRALLQSVSHIQSHGSPHGINMVILFHISFIRTSANFN